MLVSARCPDTVRLPGDLQPGRRIAECIGSGGAAANFDPSSV